MDNFKFHKEITVVMEDRLLAGADAAISFQINL